MTEAPIELSGFGSDEVDQIVIGADGENADAQFLEFNRRNVEHNRCAGVTAWQVNRPRFETVSLCRARHGNIKRRVCSFR
jgi:hypothetical protein